MRRKFKAQRAIREVQSSKRKAQSSGRVVLNSPTVSSNVGALKCDFSNSITLAKNLPESRRPCGGSGISVATHALLKGTEGGRNSLALGPRVRLSKGLPALASYDRVLIGALVPVRQPGPEIPAEALVKLRRLADRRRDYPV